MGCWRVLLLVLLATFLVGPARAGTEQLVSGHYLQGVGKEIEIGLEIGAPAPMLVIVIQNLPGGIGVVGSKPELKKYDPEKGVAKWLLNKVAAGRMTVSLQLARPVGPGEISGEIRYRNEAGEMVGIPLKN